MDGACSVSPFTTQWTLGLFPPLATVDNTAVNVSGQAPVQVPAFNSSEFICKSGTAGPRGDSGSGFGEQSYCFPLQLCPVTAHQKRTGFPFLHILADAYSLPFVVCLFDNINPPVRAAASRRGFDLRFPNDW